MKSRKVLLVGLMVIVAFCGIGMSASDTTQVQATIAPFITLTVPDSIGGLTLSPGDNTQAVSGLAVTSNAPWHIFVQTAKDIPDQGNDYYGHFWSPAAYAAGYGASVNGHGPGFLTNALVLNAGSGDVPLSDEPAPLASSMSLGTTQVPSSAKQTVTLADPAANDYRIALEFTASN